MKKIMIAVALMVCACGCSTHRHVQSEALHSVATHVEEGHTLYDTVLVRDTLRATVRGDTVWMERVRETTRNRLVRDTVCRVVTDTVCVVRSERVERGGESRWWWMVMVGLGALCVIKSLSRR